MKKLNALALQIMLLLSLTHIALGQNYNETQRSQKKALTKLSLEFKDNNKWNRERLLALAKQKKWDVFKVNKDGSIMGLQTIDAQGNPIYLITNNLSSARTIRTNGLWPGGSTGLNLNGNKSSLAGKIAIWDGAKVLDTHQEFTGRIKLGDNSSSVEDHTTHVAGTIIAAGINPEAKGMAFAAPDLYSYDFFDDDAEMAKAAADRGLLLSNHSYGNIAGWRFNSNRAGTTTDPQWEWWGLESDSVDYKFGSYVSFAANWDKIAYNAPYYLIIKSAGNNRDQNGPGIGQPYFQRNTGGDFKLVNQRIQGKISNNSSYDILSTTSNAKNILVVGAIEPLINGYNKPSDVNLAPFSCWGPTDDGRIKPDVVSLGINVLSSTAASDDSYSSMDGTSMAAPSISGTALLLQEHYSNRNSNNFMRAATLKGLIIHSTEEAGSAPGPDYQNGWGLVNAQRAAQLISTNGQNSLLQEGSLNQGESYQTQFIASGVEPLAITVTWTDPDALPTPDGVVNSRTIKLINDLDIRLSKGADNYLPWILDPANPGKAASSGDNIRDNIEKIFIAAPVPGEVYTLTVSHKGTLKNGKQDYSIIASGIGGQSYCASAGQATTGSRITNVTLGTINNSTAGVCTGYSNFSNLYTEVEPGQILPIGITTGICAIGTNSIIKVFADWNNNGNFNDNGDLVATGTGIIPGNIFNTSITTPDSVVSGKIIKIRIVLQEGIDPSSVLPCGSYSSGETEDYALITVPPSDDMAVIALLDPDNNSCQNSVQKITLNVQNKGTSSQSNIPITTILSDENGLIKTFNGIIKGPLSQGESFNFTYPETFASTAEKKYILNTTINLSGDQVNNNNQLIQTVVINAVPPTPALTASRCDDNSGAILQAATTTLGATYWYESLNSTTPIAVGSNVFANTNATTLYGGLNDFSGSVGPINKSVFGFNGNAYNQFDPSIKITTYAPIIIEKARLYIGHSGVINFSVTNARTGEQVSSVTLNVTATRNPESDGAQPVDPNDPGAIYDLNLEIPAAGDYLINTSYEDGATILRNNAGVSGYPFEIPGVLSITGNTASQTNNMGPLNYYYYLYDIKVKAYGCTSPRGAVTVGKPVITLVNGELVSDQSANNQWYLNDRLIANAINQNYRPEYSGTYQVKVENNCISSSNEIEYIRADIPSSIGMKIYPVPATEIFTLQFTSWETNQLEVNIIDLNGKNILKETGQNFSGFFSKTYRLDGYASGIYIVEVKLNNKNYSQKISVHRQQ